MLFSSTLDRNITTLNRPLFRLPMGQGFVDLHTEWPLVRKIEMAVSSFPHEQRVGTDDTDPITYEAVIER